MKKYILGIDIGTGSCKSCIINDEGKLIATESDEYDPLIIKQGWIEQNPDTWFKAVLNTLHKLSCSIDFKKIAAVGVAGQMRGLTFIDNSGNILRNSILWNDLRNVEEVSIINKKYSDIIQKVTKNPLNTMCTLPKVLWIIRKESHIWEKTYKIIYPKDYINFKLTGKLQTDLSDASGSSFYDLKKQSWSDEILEIFSISKNKLPDIFPSTSIIGEINKEASTITGIPQGTPVIAGGSDSTVESFSIGLTDSSQCKIRLGTSGALSTIVDNIDKVSNNKYYCWSYIFSNRWMLDTNTRSCAQSVKWLRDVFYKDKPKAVKTYEEIDDEAKSIFIGSEGLKFYPYLLGEDAPYWDSKLTGCFLGISINHKRPHFARAVYEGTAFSLRDALSTFSNLVKKFKKNIFIGGGTKAKCWLSIVADVLGIDGKIAANADAALGASMLAGIGIGIFKNAEEAIKLCNKTKSYIEYNRENHEVYNELFNKYKKIKNICDEYLRYKNEK